MCNCPKCLEKKTQECLLKCNCLSCQKKLNAINNNSSSNNSSYSISTPTSKVSISVGSKADGVFSFERKSENSHFTFRKPSNLSNPPAKKAKYDTSDDDSDDTSDSDDEDNIIKSIEKLEKRIKLLKKLRELKIKLFLARKKK